MKKQGQVKLTRSEIMGRIKGKYTASEMLDRRFPHGRGFRYRLHNRMLPGKPDIVFLKRRIAIFVNDAFGMAMTASAGIPQNQHRILAAKDRTEYGKRQNNRHVLEETGWRVITVWECELSQECLE